MKTIVCKNCGSEIAYNSKYCTVCGASVENNTDWLPPNEYQSNTFIGQNAAPNNTSAADQPKNSRKPNKLLIVLVVAAVILLGIIIGTSKSNSGSLLPEEEKIVGSWSAIGFYQNGEIVHILAGSSILVVKEDHTATLHIMGTDPMDMTWSYDSYSKGSYTYYFYYNKKKNGYWLGHYDNETFVLDTSSETPTIYEKK